MKIGDFMGIQIWAILLRETGSSFDAKFRLVT